MDMYDMDDCCGYMEMSVSMSMSPQRKGPFEFCDGLEQRAEDYRMMHPEHAAKYEGNGLIIFPGEQPWLPGVY